MYIGFSDMGRGGTQRQYKTSEWYASKKSLGIAGLQKICSFTSCGWYCK